MVKTVNISPEVASVLARCTVEGNKVRLPDGRLERPLYLETDKVLKALGGKWNRGADAHVFAEGIGDQLAAALEAGSIVDVKKTHEQFFTPPELARRMVALLDLRPGMKLLEPSAGNGALIRAAMAAEPDIRIWAYEIDIKLRAELRSEFFSQFGGGGLSVDFMEAEPNPAFDAVLMNPPFSGNQDVRHVRRAWESLKGGGRLVAIMSPHWTFAEDRESIGFRVWSKEIGATIEKLPEGTFKKSGTMVNTVLFSATKAG